MGLETVRNTVIENAVSLRGWDFPHVDRESLSSAGGYVYSVTDWERHVEFWRMYKSGQFIYLANLWDVAVDMQERLRTEFEGSVLRLRRTRSDSVRGVASFIGLIYSVTEFYVFAARYAGALDLPEIDLAITLRNAEGWALASSDPAVSWHAFYQCESSRIDCGERLNAIELLAAPSDCAVRSINRLFEGFNWLSPSEDMIRGWQERLMSRKYPI